MLTAQVDGFFGDSVRDTEQGHVKLYNDYFFSFFRPKRVAPDEIHRIDNYCALSYREQMQCGFSALTEPEYR